ncbi:MAG: hypothetical protein AB9866_02435 [Syntrophobacteraceae bacterium]
MNYSSFTDSEWSSAFQNGFSFLKEIPSSSVQSMVAIIEANPGFLDLAFLKSFATAPADIPKEERMRVDFMRNDEEGRGDWLKYRPINQIKSMITHFLKSDRLRVREDSEAIRSWLEGLQTEYEHLRTPSAGETRKAFFPELKSSLKVDPQNTGGGVWVFPIVLEGMAMELNLDFGGNYTTLTYWIDVHPDRKPRQITFVSYEQILGLGSPDWNLMRSDRLRHHSRIFVEVVSRTMQAISMALKTDPEYMATITSSPGTA